MKLKTSGKKTSVIQEEIVFHEHPDKTYDNRKNTLRDINNELKTKIAEAEKLGLKILPVREVPFGPSNEEKIHFVKEKLANYSVYDINELNKLFYPECKPGALRKDKLLDFVAENWILPAAEDAKRWFNRFSPVSLYIVQQTALNKYFSISVLKKILNKEKTDDIIKYIKDRTCYSHEYRINNDPALDFLYTKPYSSDFIEMGDIFRYCINFWLKTGLEKYDDCIAGDKAAAGNVWVNDNITESYPLLIDVLNRVYEETPDEEKPKVLRGFKKKQIDKLTIYSGFKGFNTAQKYMLYAVDMCARFVLAFTGFKPQRPVNPEEELRRLVQIFFEKIKPKEVYRIFYYKTKYFEANVLMDHLRKIQLDDWNELAVPPSRFVFQKLLRHIAKSGKWFDIDKLSLHLRYHCDNFYFLNNYECGSTKINASTITDEDNVYADINPYSGEAGSTVSGKGETRYIMFHRPLLKAYFYLFAALGVVELIEVEPPKTRMYRNAAYPVSPYDCLKYVRITEFGLWCLGMRETPPKRAAKVCKAIADKELFLVTIQGESLEHTLYLDMIGERLGEKRWKVRPETFVSGCTNQLQIQERIERFKSLIDAEPAPHWQDLFNKTLSRAGLFEKFKVEGVIYKLPPDRELLQELFSDDEIKNLAFRAEGSMIVVLKKDERRFLAALQNHAITKCPN